MPSPRPPYGYDESPRPKGGDRPPSQLPPLRRWQERFRAWALSKETLQKEILDLKRRLHALQMAKDEALSQALVFENGDFTSWLQEMAGTEKGALAVRLKQAREEADELGRQNARLRASAETSQKTLDAVMEAWESAAGLKTAKWDEKAKEWVPD